MRIIYRNNVGGETSYTLFSTIATGTNNATNIAGFAVDNTNYSDTGLSNSTTYYYYVKSYNGIGESVYSAVDADTTFSG